MPQLRFHKQVSTKSIKRRYRLSFSSENTLHEIWSVKFTRLRVTFVTIIIVLALASLISTIIVSTPLRTYLPGYIKSEQRHEYINANLRIDSLENIIANRNKYFENLQNILNEEIQTLDNKQMEIASDSLNWEFDDSLLIASKREEEFVKAFDEREQFNIEVLTPLAAQRIVFTSPIQIIGSITNNSGDMTTGIEISTPADTPVSAIYDGTVISIEYTISHGIHISIQHPEGFISQYQNLKTCYVTKGAKVSAAQRIGTTKSSNFIIELWHNGIAVNPKDFIPF